MAKTTESKIKFLEVTARESGIIDFVLGDGQQITVDVEEFSEEIRFKAMMHGFNQKIRDAAASYGKEKDYDGAFEEMMKVVDGLAAGQWNRQGGGMGAGVVMEDLAYAIATIKSVDVEKAMVAVKKASDEQRKAWAKNAKVAKLMADNKAARLAKLAESAKDDIEVDFGEE